MSNATFNTKSKGCPLDILQNAITTELLPIENKPNHTVLYKLPITTEVPEPHTGKVHWDRDHVKMPFSSHSLYTAMVNGIPVLKSRWTLIKETLSKKIMSSRELEEAIITYNPKFKTEWKFIALHALFNEILEEEESCYFFQETLPAIIALALELPNIVACGLPYLRQNKNHSISLSQYQISSLLANAFLCTFPNRNTQIKQSGFNTFPDINFNRLFGSGVEAHIIEKLKCICHYFRRVCSEVPKNVITFTRQHILPEGLPNWSECREKIGDIKFHVTSEGTIEDQGINMLQVDFANKFIGGGVLSWGCVQEEIRFVISPELIISRLFIEALKPNEAVIINGFERYSDYKGYSQSFLWCGDHKDKTLCDSSRRRKCAMVAIDALPFTNSKQQFLPRLIERELNKAFVGFRPAYGTSLYNPQPVATGNWGCGAFGGDANLKALLQMMAARITRRDFVYFTFGDQKLCEDLYEIWKFFEKNQVTIGELWNQLCAFHKSNIDAKELYTFLMQIISTRKEKII